MDEKAGREQRRSPRGRIRLRLISGDAQSTRDSRPPLRIVGSEPRLRGAFRLTDR
jgi:hypothetical protein